MAVCLSAYQVADLCLGKPPLRSLSSSATVSAALAALKSSDSDDNFISVWSCDHHSLNRLNLHSDCLCIGKICMVDIICFLCKKENLSSPSLALKSPISLLLSHVNGRVRHVDPSASIVEAIDMMIEGAQNLVVPINSSISRRKQLHRSSTAIHNGQEFCWLTQEDVLRFLLSSIGLFSPIAPLPIETLGIITADFLTVEYDRSASSAIAAISGSLADQTSVAVVDGEGTLIGEISPLTLACCDETAAAAVLTLSAGELMAYIDCGGPTEDLVRVVEERLKEKKLEEIMATISPYNADALSLNSSSSSSSDEEASSPTSTMRSLSRSWRMGRRAGAEAIVCHRGSSLVAVMIQAITRRVNYVWVMEDDCSVAGIVTFANILEVFRKYLEL